MNRAVVDLETGEIIRGLKTGDRIVRAASIEKKKNRSSRNFIKADSEEGLLILRELNSNERSLMFLLQFYVAYETCLICFPNRKALTLNDIAELSGWSRPTTSRTLKSLSDKKIICKTSDYYMNPWIISKGTPSGDLIGKFGDYEIRSKGNTKWGELNGKTEKGRRTGKSVL